MSARPVGGDGRWDARTAIRITSNKGNTVLLSGDEFNSMQETLYLLRSQANGPGWLRGRAQSGSDDAVEFRPEGDR